ncbi:MAG: helix-turn-helix domain-containing protein [Candidatus Anammoxibacter sp.]
MDEKKIKKFLGMRIKRLRKERGLTQEVASKKAGMLTEKRWSDIECGRYAIGLTTLLKIAQGLDIPIQELFKFEEAEVEKSNNKFFKEHVLKMENQVNKMSQEMRVLKKNIFNLKNYVG